MAQVSIGNLSKNREHFTDRRAALLAGVRNRSAFAPTADLFSYTILRTLNVGLVAPTFNVCEVFPEPLGPLAPLELDIVEPEQERIDRVWDRETSRA